MVDPELEIEVLEEGQPQGEEKALESKEAPAPASAEPEVEIDESDPLYKKPDWKTDPASNIEDPNDGDYGPRVQKRINKLRASLSEAAKQRDKASREAQEAINLSRAQIARIQELERTLAQGTTSYIERQAETEEANARLAEQSLRQALVVGDADAIARANSDLATARAKQAQLKSAVEFRRSQAPAPVQQPVRQQQPIQQQAQPVDQRYDGWVSKNSWFQTDQEMTEAALEHHDHLAANGVRIGSDTYYQQIDRKMRELFPDNFPGEKVAATKKVSPAMAPTTRQAAGSSQQTNGATPNKVKLTPTQVATAQRLGLTPQQYAKELIKLRAAGMDV